MPGRETFRYWLDRQDDRLSRLGLLGSTLTLTLLAIIGSLAVHVLIRTLEHNPVQSIALQNITLQTGLAAFPIILYARRVITALHRSKADLAFLSRQLEIAAEEAQQANRAKSQFLANMSHELRTPLNAIMGFSEVMKDQHMGPVNNPRYLSYAKDIHASGRYLLGIINDILDLSKIEAGKMSLESAEEFGLSATMTASLGMVETLATKFGVTVSADLPGEQVRLVAVERMVRQILINLVGNAIKFTPVGGSVHVSGCRLADGGCEIVVRDSGIGMDEDGIAQALTPFGQITNMMSAKHTGTGLGLPLARAMTELHGGTLSIASAPQQGTTVTLIFPQTRVAERAAA